MGLLPLTLWSAWLIAHGQVSDQHAHYLVRALYATGRGKLELLGFAFPPLPLVALLPWPSPWLAWAWGVAALGALLWIVGGRAVRHGDPLPVLVVLSVIASPVGMAFLVEDFNDAIGLALMLAGWFAFVRWGARGFTYDGMVAGLCLGLAAFSSRLAIPACLSLGAMLTLLFPLDSRRALLARFVILAFPVAAMAFTFAYLAWLFDFEFKLLPPSTAPPTPLGPLLLHALAYLAVGMLQVTRGARLLAIYLLPLAAIIVVSAMGVGLSLPLATAALALAAGAALPRPAPDGSTRWRRRAVAGIAAVQLLGAWWLDPRPTPPDGALAMRRAALALVRAQPLRVLMDEERSIAFTRWLPTVRPFLLTRDAAYPLAAANPAAYVDYVVVSPGSAIVAERWGMRPPPGFVEAWRRDGHVIYERIGAPPLGLAAPDGAMLSAGSASPAPTP